MTEELPGNKTNDTRSVSRATRQENIPIAQVYICLGKKMLHRHREMAFWFCQSSFDFGFFTPSVARHSSPRFLQTVPKYSHHAKSSLSCHQYRLALMVFPPYRAMRCRCQHVCFRPARSRCNPSPPTTDSQIRDIALSIRACGHAHKIVCLGPILEIQLKSCAHSQGMQSPSAQMHEGPWFAKFLAQRSLLSFGLRPVQV